MESSVQRLLSDKLYDKRKAGALELENIIKTAFNEHHADRISRILNQLVHDFAYAVHQPHARNGGLIGLAAAAIALGPAVSPYLSLIVPPVLACFSDQDARVRYYACESMYNIAKVAKGEILVYFNDVFDALCKLAADTEMSVKNGAELLDRLVKDIVAESAATYASIIIAPGKVEELEEAVDTDDEYDGRRQGKETAFSLPRFIPLLKERIHVINPFTRTFLVSWITLLDSIPDLELVAYLPDFLGGLLRFLSDPNQDVHTTTKVALDRFLAEIKQIAAVKKGITEHRKSREMLRTASGELLDVAVESPTRDDAEVEPTDAQVAQLEPPSTDLDESAVTDAGSWRPAVGEDQDEGEKDLDSADIDVHDFEDEWIPGQDVAINYQQILDILLTFLASASYSTMHSEEEIQIITLKWIESFLDICPEDILVFTPRLLAQVLPALSSDVEKVKSAAGRVNESLTQLVIAFTEQVSRAEQPDQEPPNAVQAPQMNGTTQGAKSISGVEKQQAPAQAGAKQSSTRNITSPEPIQSPVRSQEVKSPQPVERTLEESTGLDTLQLELDYEAAVNALTKQFLHEHEATRVAALAWLIMLHRKSPRRILAIQDATFPALLKTLSDPADAVVTRDLLLLSQISKSSDDSYFSSFMVNLLKLFSSDRRLLEMRGNLIIRQLCLSLSAEKIYRTMADSLERDEYGEDIEFAAIMVQNLNNNLITAPELQELRKRLRNLDTRDGQTFFTVLFRAWCVNAVATFSLCLLAQAYEQAYNLLQIFAELEMTVNMLIQIDKLVQLLESPVFTYLRMQLLEPERYPHLYKCLYGLLMLLPQSSAFAALKNRLGSVSAIGYLHVAPRGVPTGSGTGATPSSVSTFERQNRLKGREDGTIRWGELLDKFKATQEKVRRSQQRQLMSDAGLEDEDMDPRQTRNDRAPSINAMAAPNSVTARPQSALSFGSSSVQLPSSKLQSRDGKGKEVVSMEGAAGIKHKSGFSQLGRLATGRKKGKEK